MIFFSELVLVVLLRTQKLGSIITEHQLVQHTVNAVLMYPRILTKVTRGVRGLANFECV